MIKMYENTQTIKGFCTFNEMPLDTWDYVQNLGHELGSCTWNNNVFEPYLEKLVKKGVLVKLYDFVDNGYREASYEFVNGKGEIEILGTNHMSYILNYNF